MQISLSKNQTLKKRIYLACFGLSKITYCFLANGRDGKIELATPCTQNRCATRLRYAPTDLVLNKQDTFGKTLFE